MILQALVKLYEDLRSRGEIAAEGWSPVKINYAVCIDGKGSVIQIIPQIVEELRGKKTVRSPRQIMLPAPVTKSSGIVSNFLWENADYILGIPKDPKDREKSAKRFTACREKHHELLDNVSSNAAKAVLAFFDNWDNAHAAMHPEIREIAEELRKGCNLTFRFEGGFVSEDTAVKKAWDEHYGENSGKALQCLVTGEYGPYEPIHPKIKGVNGAQSSGASIVSFNAPAFCSYDKEQNANAPVGKYASFAYTAALNHLLADKNYVQHIGDATVVFWADGAKPQYRALSLAALFGNNESSGFTDEQLQSAVARLAKGLPVEELDVEADRTFYILGLSPNASRLSVRFFLKGSFGSFMKNINEHHERMRIDRPSFDKFETVPLWKLLSETVNPNARDKSANPILSGAVARAIFSGGPYPVSLIESIMLRIRAEHDVSRIKAAIIKAYYLKNQNQGCPKEVLTVSLNESSTNTAYNLGRLFSVYEAVQQKANPGINSTIRDKYFSSAAATPANIFPVLDNLCQKHLKKLDEGSRIYFGRQIGDIKNRFGEELPLRLSLPQQGSFNLGYYHQTQKRYTKKEEN
ncbi:MAG: type I-C CRISPR-associated protein Cas8c/Csd1 [Clostridia bacterium]|nr:type I-C CRISPR-associated protein Cas8c/Csd1 [Clostridia bacterium]